MRKLTTVATLTLTATLLSTPAHAGPAPHSMRPCATDEAEGVFCVWDARHMGNGVGRSFKIGREGKFKYISHRRAHRLTDWSYEF